MELEPTPRHQASIHEIFDRLFRHAPPMVETIFVAALRAYDAIRLNFHC